MEQQPPISDVADDQSSTRLALQPNPLPSLQPSIALQSSRTFGHKDLEVKSSPLAQTSRPISIDPDLIKLQENLRKITELDSSTESSDKQAHKVVVVTKDGVTSADIEAFQKQLILLAAARKPEAKKPESRVNNLRNDVSESCSRVTHYIGLLISAQRSKWWFLKQLASAQIKIKSLQEERAKLEAQLAKSEKDYKAVHLKLENLGSDVQSKIKFDLIESLSNEAKSLNEIETEFTKAKAEMVDLKAKFDLNKETVKRLKKENVVAERKRGREGSWQGISTCSAKLWAKLWRR